jgi:dUTP pyrophosphatase
MKKDIDIEIMLEKGATLPYYATKGAAGADLFAAISEPITLKPGKSALISTGLRVALPKGYELQIRPRSGTALKYGITVLNTPGTIDSDYRGVIGVILINHSDEEFVVNPSDRIAQAVFAPYVYTYFHIVEELSKTDRGEGGFGHSGR